MNQDSRCGYKPTPVVFFFFLFWISSGFGQVLSISAAGLEISEERVLQYRKIVEQDSSVPGQTRQKIFELYDKALALLAQNKEIRSRIESFRQMQASLPEEMEKARQALGVFNQPSGLPSAEGLSIAELEEKLAAARTDWDEARKNAEQVQQEMLRRTHRRTQIPQELLTARGQMDQMKQQPPLVVPFRAAEPAHVSALVSQIQMEAFRLQMELLEEEEKAYTAAEPLMMLERDVWSRRLAEAERQVRFWEQTLQQARLREVRQIQAQAEQAARQSQGTHPVLQQLLLENAELAYLQAERIRQLEETARYALSVETQLRSVSNDFENIQAQIARAGQVTSALGVLLVTKKNDLPDLREHQRQIRRRTMESSAVQLEWGKYDRQWSDLADVPGQAAFRLASAGLSERDENDSALLPKVIELLSRQRELLQSLTASTRQYLAALAQLDIQERSLVSTVQAYQRFIEENSFWVKNTSLFSIRDTSSVLRVIREWISGSRWHQIFLAVRQDAAEEWGLHIVCAVGWIGLFRCRRWFKKTLGELAEKVRAAEPDRFFYTVYALLLSVFSASVGPLVPFYLGWRLKAGSALYPEAVSLSAALLALAVCLFVYRFLRSVSGPAGLGEHFRLPADFLNTFRRHIGWYFRILIPLVFVWYLTEDAAIEETARNGVLRLLFLARQILLMVFLLVLLRPSGLFVSSCLPCGHWLYAFRYVWYGVCWLVPLFFCYLSILGYGFTARQLEQHLQETILFLLAVLFVYGMLIRWLSVLQKALHLQPIESVGPAAPAESAAPSKESRTEHSPEWFAHLFGQTRKLINALVFVLMAAGVFWIWRSVLPAFGVLEKVHLWTSSDAQGQVKVITMAGLFRALIITILTVILTRNIPGFLEVSLLRRFPLDAGVRFAITSICRYVLVIVGIMLVSSELGIRWSSIQWLIAALGVGLGFGLQEVFANFICGLLLLLERPLRVGDVVTIGEITGRVTRIQTRATTIQLWDRKELVVPNREFITGRLINWTLSDTVLRLAFPVGVAYGSDIKKVEQVLYRIARSHPNVIQDDPAPCVVFDSFGDSALQFELRVYIPSMDCLVDVKHQINCAIDEEFRKEGIEIAFPQRDLHIRSIRAVLPVQPSEPSRGS